MKILIGALLIFAIISGICLYSDSYLNDTVGEMNKYIDSIHFKVLCEDFKEAKKDFDKLKKEWDDKEKYIQLQTEHSELDTINEQFAVISSHFDHNEYDEFFETLYKLQYFLNHITEKKKLNLKTIL